MSVYNNWFIAKARKFEPKAFRTDKGTITLEVNVYDGLKLDATPDQWAAIIDTVNRALASGAPASGGRQTAPPQQAPPPEDY